MKTKTSPLRIAEQQQALLTEYLSLSAELTAALDAKYDLEKQINTLRHKLKVRETALRLALPELHK